MHHAVSYHLIKNITGEEVVLYVGDLDSDWDAVVIRSLLQKETTCQKNSNPFHLTLQPNLLTS